MDPKNEYIENFIRLDPELSRCTRENLRAAGLLEWVELIQGAAAEVVKELDGLFDLIFQDSAKTLYPRLFSTILPIGGGLAVSLRIA